MYTRSPSAVSSAKGKFVQPNTPFDSGVSATHTEASDDAELCLAEYCARQFAGSVVLYAIGVHLTSGCAVIFRRDSGDSFPPSFSLWHIRSGASELQTVTPFSTSVAFQTIKRVSHVVVTDAAGTHRVPVEQSN